jgi:hypothetical protein
MTSLLMMLVQPIGSAALSRMPQALESLAVWPVISGMIFMLRSLGFAYNEVVVALLEEPGSSHTLRRFATYLTIFVTVLMLLLAATPLAGLWFGRVSALEAPLAALARQGVWVALLMPGLSVLQNWHQGAILYGQRTRGITEAVVIFLLVCSAILWGGVARGQMTGLYVGLAAFVIAGLAQTMWLWYRSRPVRCEVRERDQS